MQLADRVIRSVWVIRNADLSALGTVMALIVAEISQMLRIVSPGGKEWVKRFFLVSA